MIKKSIFMSALCLAASAGNAQEFSPYDGVWFGSQRTLNESGGLTAELAYTFRSSGGLGILQVSDRKASPPVDRRCTYAFKIADQAGKEVVNAAGNSADCPETSPISFGERTATSLQITADVFSSEATEVIGIRVPYLVLPPQPESFDTLGVSTRKTRAEIEENLLNERGWTKLEPSSGVGVSFSVDPQVVFTRSRDWYSEFAVYVADPEVNEARSNSTEFGDRITVAYEAAPSEEAAMSDSVRAIVVQRSANYQIQDRAVNIEVLMAALADKYGTIQKDMFNNTPRLRAFDLNGNQLPDVSANSDHECSGNSNERLSSFSAVIIGSLTSYPYAKCGPAVEIHFGPVRDGLASQVRTTLRDDPFVLNLSVLEEAPRIKAEIEKVLADAAGDNTPEL